jgi:predicted O-methyltransferase YrrM
MSAWFAGKELTTDWLKSSIDRWFSTLAHLRDKPADILEVGSYEGRSAIAFLSYLPLSRVTCVDTFYPNDENRVIEGRFDRNMAPFGDRVVKIKDHAANALDLLRIQKASFDVIYLDAGKKRDWVFALSTLAWPLLRTGGIMIWDDLRWGVRDGVPSPDRPGDAIKLFRDCFLPSLEVIHEQKQLIVRKTSDWPAPELPAGTASG